MNAKLLTTASDRKEWLQAYEASGDEPFAHPAFQETMAAAGEVPRCFFYEGVEGAAIMPLTIRPVPLPARMGACDAISPYGYGGPFLIRGELDERFLASLVSCLREAQVVSFFGRLSLNIDFAKVPDGVAAPATLTDNVVVDLNREPDEQWMHYDHKVRKNVKKAQRAGLTASILDDFADVDEFTRLYLDTMYRRSAPERYRFDSTFFKDIVRSVPRCVVAEVRTDDGRLVSAELVLRSERRLYSFLGGTDASYFAHAPNDLLKDAVIRFGSSMGMGEYVLGGGYVREDGIFRYKRGFDRDGVRPFKGLRIVVDQAEYDRLCSVNAAETGDPAIGSDFFPSYRVSAG